MSKIQDYAEDVDIIGNEELIGSDSDKTTRNYKLSAIANYLAISGEADAVGDSFSFHRETTLDNDDAQAKFGLIVNDAVSSAEVALSTITKLRIAKVAKRGITVLPLLSKWNNSIIRLGLTGNTEYALFTLSGIDSLTDENSNWIDITIAFDSGDGTEILEEDAQITISDVASVRIGGATIHSGTSIPDPTLGEDGDIYFQLDDPNNVAVVFGPKTAGAWGDGLDLHGQDGSQGPAGPQGDPGTDGADGDSAYQVWLSQGNSGSVQDYLNSLQGAKGDKGDQGDPGPTGPAGSDGTDGATILSGASAPTDSDGNEGDFFLETTNSHLYGPKGATSWPATFLDLKGDQGDGFTGGSYDSSTGVVTFTSDDGIGFATGDLRGADGTDGRTILSGTTDPDDTDDGVDGDFYMNTSTNTFFGPKTSGAWGTGTVLSSALTVSEGDDSVANVSTLNIVGDNVALTQSGNTATLTFSGSSTPVEPAVISALAFSGFTQDQFPNIDQSVTIDQHITPNSETITNVVFSSTDNDAAQVSVTDTTADSEGNYTTGAVTLRGGPNAGDSVTISAVTTHNEPGEADQTTTKTHTFAPVRTTKPSRVHFLSNPTGWAYTPNSSDHHLEDWDSGDFDVLSTYDLTDNNGWDVGTITYNHSVSGGSVSVSSSNSNFDFNGTATITQASTPDSSGGNSDKISEDDYQVNNDPTYTRIKSIRTGGHDGSDWTDDNSATTGLRNLSIFSSTTREIDFGTRDPDGARVRLANGNGEYLYIIYDSSYPDLDLGQSKDDGVGGNLNEIAGGFSKVQTIGGYKVYESASSDNAQTLLSEDYYVTLVTQ